MGAHGASQEGTVVEGTFRGWAGLSDWGGFREVGFTLDQRPAGSRVTSVTSVGYPWSQCHAE